MDVLYFLTERLNFIKQFYDVAAAPFRETKRKIEDKEPPFDDPPYSEDAEPAYLVEWIEADTSLKILGQTCISMLSESLKLYFKTWERELGLKWSDPKEKNAAFDPGIVSGYRAFFEAVLENSWDACPADVAILEQVILARNRGQHPEHIASILSRHTEADRAKFPNLFFVSNTDRKMLSDAEIATSSWMAPTLDVSAEGLKIAIGEVEKLAGWLDPQLQSFQYLPRK